jgi:hypothetical protein
MLKFMVATALLDEEAEVEDIIWGLKAWLEKHPTETIFVSLKVDNGDPEGAEVKALMKEVLATTRSFWVNRLTTVRPILGSHSRILNILIVHLVKRRSRQAGSCSKIPSGPTARSNLWIRRLSRMGQQ